MELKVEVRDPDFTDFEDQVVRAAAANMTAPIKEKLDEIIKGRVLELIDESVGSILAGVIENPIQKTNQWGEAVGGTMTLREVILKAGIDWFSQHVDSYGRNVQRYHDGMPRVQYMAKKTIEEGIGKELQEQIKTATQEVKAQMDGKIKLAVEQAVKNIIAMK